MSPTQIKHVVNKCKQAGKNQNMLCESGSCFGYDNLVVDMLGFRQKKGVSDNVFINSVVTRNFQNRDAFGDASGGRYEQVV